MKLFLLCVVSIIALIGRVQCLEFKDCGSLVGKFTKIEVSGCDTTKSTCTLKRNSEATISIEFEMLGEHSTTNVTAIVHGIIMGIPMPFPLLNPDGCLNCGLECPLTKEQTYKYSATLAVLKSYPKVHVDVKWELKDDENKDIVCVMIPAKLE